MALAEYFRVPTMILDSRYPREGAICYCSLSSALEFVNVASINSIQLPIDIISISVSRVQLNQSNMFIV